MRTMHGQRRHRPVAAPTLALTVAALLLAACSGSTGATGSAATTATTALGPRPASTAKLTVLSPHNGQTVHSQTPEVRLGLQGARIVAQTSTHIRPDQGHVHLLVDGKLVAMNYGLNERLPKLSPGEHLVQVEFVAADHAPFDPRVLAQAAFIVTP
jgi:hypothetical protein